MDEKKILKIKEAIRRNFEQSPYKYETFEQKHGFFSALNAALIDTLDIHGNPRILDIGCGTGASSRQILSAIPGSKVWGLDNSPAMLEIARKNNPASLRLKFIEGDAADIRNFVKERMDVVIYSASIFLIPDYKASLNQAWELLELGGKLGLTYMVGIFENSGENAFVSADHQARTNVSQKKPVEFDSLTLFVENLFSGAKVQTKDFICDIEMLRAFFSIPAMSAGLYPSLVYEDRLKMLKTLFSHLSCDNLSFRWNLITATKQNSQAIL
ncbi:MAG: class I SAM-dependent methyltransferase [Desulfomonilaceae bacterium]